LELAISGRTGAMKRAELRIGNRLAELESVRRWIERFGTAHALPVPVLTSLLVSFDEVLSNIISYGYRDAEDHEIRLSIALQGDTVVAEVEDDGVAYDPLGTPPPQLSGGVGERSPGGLGVHFVRTLNDEVAYERRGDRNRLSFSKRVPDAA
jgi:anti-sigma regulatory factor (Ser/Thr protein kinase)